MRLRPLLAALAAVVIATLPSTSAAQAPADAPDWVIGFSAEGRPIEVACLGGREGDPVVLAVGGLHTGTERVTSDLALEVALATADGRFALPAGVRLCVIPTLNPDGIASGLHTNANHVDLNRNWPAPDWNPEAYHPETGPVSGGTQPLSEPETRALHHYVKRIQPALVVVWHCCGSLVEANDAFRAVGYAFAYADATDFSYLDKWVAYPTSGELIDALELLGVPAIDVEMVEHGDTDLDRHLRGLGAVLKRVALHRAGG